MVDVGMKAPAVAEIFVAVDDHAGLFRCPCPQITAGEPQPVFGRERDRLSRAPTGLTFSGMKSG